MTEAKVPMPWSPAPYDVTVCGAANAFVEGKATADQQRILALWLRDQVCGYLDLSFKPGPDGAAATTFHEGKRFVWAQLVKVARPETAAALAKANARKRNEANEAKR